ncbi:MAG: cellulase N-terminal Ig-like domain-containing protein, partial [Bacteroidota bacterium]
MARQRLVLLGGLFAVLMTESAESQDARLRLNDLGYFETRGLNVLVFNNWYDGNFSDAKMSGIEIIHHGVRTATNGDVRLSPTPEQWDAIPQLVGRKEDRGKVEEKVKVEDKVEVELKYPDFGFNYRIVVETEQAGVLMSVVLDKPLPRELEGRAGLNMEFLPSAYFEKSYSMDGTSGIFPLYPVGPTEVSSWGTVEASPFAHGKTLVLAPEDPERRVSIVSRTGDLLLLDGRNKAQNGWFVVRTLIPSGKSGTVVQWFLTASTIPNWIRQPVIAHSQVGYHPRQKKVAVLEFDKNEHQFALPRLLKVNDSGQLVEAFKDTLRHWGNYLRYHYAQFDFSSVAQNGLYLIEYGNLRTKPFRISPDVHSQSWQPALDVYFPVQMDHMLVN